MSMPDMTDKQLADQLIVETSAGTVRGTVDTDTKRWLGIPYAAAPVGPLRFRAPQPADTWTGIREADSFGNIAPQLPNKLIPFPPGITPAEDCLNLNIWAPLDAPSGSRASSSPTASRPGKKKPVMVWIHGGAYFVGFSAQPVYNGRQLAANGDVVIVTINYRLGALGFVDFSAYNNDAYTFDRNVGMRDIVAALQWVKKNIAAFGGDPDDVTLFGESAGGGCVTTLMTSPYARGLFHKAIAESSPTTSVYGEKRAQQMASQYLKIVGIDEHEAAEQLHALDSIDLARPTMQMLDYAAVTWPGTVAFAPMIDGDFIPEPPVNVFREGRQARIPLVIGTNHDEAALFKMLKSPLLPNRADTVRQMISNVIAENPELSINENEILSAYKSFPKQKGAMQVSTDAGFRLPSIWVAEAHARVAPTWMYRFDKSTPLLRLLGMGAPHSAEIPLVFGTLPKKASRKTPIYILGGLKSAHTVSARMQKYWTTFARIAKPEPHDELSWPRYDDKTRKTMTFNKTDRVVSDPDASIRLAWGDQPLGYR